MESNTVGDDFKYTVMFTAIFLGRFFNPMVLTGYAANMQ